MPNAPRLFSVALWLLRAAMALCIAIGVAMVVGIAALPLIASDLSPDHFGIPAVINGIDRTDILIYAAYILASGAISFALFALCFRAAAAIVGSARQGDPFVAENAARMRLIGWLLLAVQAIGLATATFYEFAPVAVREAYLNLGASPVALLAILMIFVLARIFRHGAEMRADLEGTV